MATPITTPTLEEQIATLQTELATVRRKLQEERAAHEQTIRRIADIHTAYIELDQEYQDYRRTTVDYVAELEERDPLRRLARAAVGLH